jgi:hypothetical protein
MSRALVTVLVVVALASCRTAEGGGSQDVPASIPSAALGAEAPEACGFPPGTPLEFAGRATTAGLDVQEVVGDPMSDDPADIYITRDPFDQGELHGRLVCAVFVNDPGFVEITVHPEDGGRFEPVEPTPRSTQPPNGVPKAEAIDIASAEVPADEGWELFDAFSAPLGEMAVSPDSDAWSAELSADLWVWNVEFIREDMLISVYLDYVDGSVLGTTRSIVN